MQRKLLPAVPALVMAAATWLAYTGQVPAGWFRAPWDKAAHAGLYGWLAGCLAAALPAQRWSWAAGIPLAVALADEYTQSFSRLRSPDLWDFAADAAGIAAACAVAARWRAAGAAGGERS